MKKSLSFIFLFVLISLLESNVMAENIDLLILHTTGGMSGDTILKKIKYNKFNIENNGVNISHGQIL